MPAAGTPDASGTGGRTARRRRRRLLLVVIVIRLPLALAALAGSGLLPALALFGRAALEFAGAAVLRAALLPLRTALRSVAAGTALPLQVLAPGGATFAPPHGRTAGRATLRTTAEISLWAAVALLATSELRALAIRTLLPLFAAIFLPRSPALFITPTPVPRAALRTLLLEALPHPFAHHLAQVASAVPLRRTAAEPLHGRTHRATLTPTPVRRAASRALLLETLPHPFAHHLAQVATAAPFLGSTAERRRPLPYRAAAKILLRRAHAPALATTPVLCFARRTQGPLVILCPLARTLPLIHARTTPGRPHRAAFVVAIPGTLRRRTEGRAHQQGGGE